MGKKRDLGGFIAVVVSLWPFAVFLPLVLGQAVPPTLQLVAHEPVGVGTPFAVDLRVEDARGVAGWEADVTYDSAALEYGGFVDGGYIEEPYQVIVRLHDEQPGLASVARGSVKERAGILGSYTFTGTMVGFHEIGLSGVRLTDIEAREYENPNVWGVVVYVGPTPTPTATVTNTPTVTPTPTATPTSTPTPVCVCTYWDGREAACTELP